MSIDAPFPIQPPQRTEPFAEPKLSGIKLVIPSLQRLKAASTPSLASSSSPSRFYPPTPPTPAKRGRPPKYPQDSSISREPKAPKPTGRPRKKQKFNFTEPAAKGRKKEKGPKIPRPVKLKPLREVLGKLVVQLQKYVPFRCILHFARSQFCRKDDYAFFLRPVDIAKVPGYSNVVKRPMDLGTMQQKVKQGKYRSLEEFAVSLCQIVYAIELTICQDDLRLVTGNAKAFNPPDSIYFTEAEKLESWGLDHISKAAGTVIQYETDWNIDVVQDDNDDMAEPSGEHSYAHSEDDQATPMDVDQLSRAASVAPSTLPPESTIQPAEQGIPPGLLQVPFAKRTTRGALRKTAAPTPANAATPAVKETLDASGRLPGSKDGLGVFPPGSELAKLMLAMKLKG